MVCTADWWTGTEIPRLKPMWYKMASSQGSQGPVVLLSLDSEAASIHKGGGRTHWPRVILGTTLMWKLITANIKPNRPIRQLSEFNFWNLLVEGENGLLEVVIWPHICCGACAEEYTATPQNRTHQAGVVADTCNPGSSPVQVHRDLLLYNSQFPSSLFEPSSRCSSFPPR